jgi:hypothetical protein
MVTRIDTDQSSFGMAEKGPNRYVFCGILRKKVGIDIPVFLPGQ